MPAYALDNQALFRTDFFPGLVRKTDPSKKRANFRKKQGWMLKRQLWQEIGPVFPPDQWDHWMRQDTVSGGRSCIVPRAC
jgi:hypothetical protein